MGIKDLFDIRIKTFQNQSNSLATASLGAESADYIKEKEKINNIYVPLIDFSTASNFAKYGSAELYYDFAFKRIFNHYPYDGTLAEKVQFESESTHLDRYIFEYLYPRTNGYVNLGYQGFDGTKDSSGFNDAVTKEYIFVLGGIHTASGGMAGKPIQSVFDKSNIYDVSNDAKKGASLEFKPVSGSTIEFWLKKDAFNTTYADNEVIFDFWNQEISSSSAYGRLTLNINNSQDFVLRFDSGSTTDTRTISHSSLNISDGNWHHYAVSFQKVDSTTEIKFYQDGERKHVTSSAATIGEIKGVSKGLSATIGALNVAPSGSTTLVRGDGKFSGSMDEFRYWKKARTEEEIGLDWFTQVGGGTNKHSHNQELGLYFKFNEGITGTSQDSVILDYSGRIANGTWTGYTSGARNTGSALVLSGKAKSEFKDPIIYSYHPAVSSKHTEMKTSGSIQDDENNSLLYTHLPSWLIEEDELSGKNVKYISQIVASYFDTVYAQIYSIDKIKDITYSTGSLSPNVLSNDILRERGFVMPSMFADANVIETYRAKDRNEVYEKDISKVKQIIYQNIYNNLSFIYKSKGTEKSYRNLFRCMGFDTEMVKVNMYCDNSTLLVEDRYESKSVVKPVVKFNAENNMSATIYQSSSNGQTYISGSESDTEQYTSISLEADFILPKKLKEYETGFFNTSFLTASVVGFHRALTSSAANYTWHPDDYYMKMYAIRDEIESDHVKFMLTGSGFKITSSLYRMAYDNQKWLLAARLRHEDYPYAGITGSTGAHAKNYIVELHGINTNGPYIDNGPFTITASVSNAIGKNLLSVAKRVYAGSHRTNYTGSVIEKSDIHLSQVRYWQSYISDDEIKQHAFDSVNYGVDHAMQTDSLFATPELEIPKSETLALHWDFGQVTTSDSSGEFTFGDRSSGSVSHASKYSFIGNITNRLHEGKGEFFPTSSKDVVDKASIYSAKRKPAESAYSSDGIKIVGEDTEAFFQDDDRNDIYFSFEKSPYGAISDEMMNMFASIKDFSNMIGFPVDRYRSSYKTADSLRQAFFEKVTNIPDPERYFEYYKWIDSSVSYAIAQLLPASTRFGDSVKNIVESHLFERNKYREKYHFTSERVGFPAGSAIGSPHSKVNWAISHAPPPQSPIPNHKHCYWQKIRRRFSDPEPTPAPISAPGIDTLRDRIHSNNIEAAPRLLDSDGNIYEGGTYAIRTINKSYDFTAVLRNTIHGGTNYYVGKKRDFVHHVARPHGPVNSKGTPVNVMVVGVGKEQGLVDQVNCEDRVDPNLKVKYDFHGFLGEFSDGASAIGTLSDANEYTYQVKGIMSFPMNFMSQSVSGGYADAVNSKFKTNLEITNLHSDTIHVTNDIPMQGPFTETHVGGHQSRHIKINKYDTTLRDDETGTAPTNNIHNLYTRPEAWRLLIGEHSSSTYNDGALGIVPADYGVTINVPISDPRYGKYPDIAKKKATYYRVERAKRPVNVRHIQHDSDGTRVGNYNKKYEVLSAVGRKENNLLFRVSSSLSYYLTPRISASLPDTTHPMSLFGQMPSTSSKGNVFGYHYDLNPRQPDGKIGAPTVASFTITGSGVTGSASGGIRIKEAGLGNQIVTTTSIAGKNFIIELGSSPSADSDPNYYVVTGASSTAFWDNYKNKINTVLTNYSASYSVSTPVNSRNLYASGAVRSYYAITASSIPDFNINNSSFGFSSWLYLKSADSNTNKKTLFSFKSGSGEMSRELYLTGAALRYAVKYYQNGSPGTKKTVTYEWPDYETLTSGSWVNTVLYHNRSNPGTGSVSLYVNGQQGTTYGLAAPSVSVSGTIFADNLAYMVESDGNIFFLNEVFSGLDSPWLGAVDEITIWDGVNITTDADTLYNGGKQVQIVSNCALPTGNLKAYYSFTDKKGLSSEVIDDVSGNGNSLTSSANASGFFHITGGSNVTGIQTEQFADFVVTALTGGSVYDFTPSISTGCQNFATNPQQLSTGFISGASPNGDDTIQFSSSNGLLSTPTFQIVNEINNVLISPSNIAVTASHTGSNLQFWNALSQSIKDNTVFGTINIVTSSGGAGHPQATFSLTSSTNNEIYNDYEFKTVNNTTGKHTFISSGSFTGGDTEVDAAFDMVLAVPGRNASGDNHRTETIISSKFSAPGGPEVQSAGFLDVYSREYSVHNAMPYRNLTVRGKSSGEVGTIKLNTHLDKREGLATLLTRHCGKFGIDSKYGAVSETSYNTNASFHKQHRNTLSKYILSGTVGSTTESVVLGSKKDNALVASPLPRSEFQYSWINSAVSGTGNWKSQHNILGYAPPSGLMQEKNVYNGYAHFYSQTSYINIGTGTTWNNILNTAPYRFSIGGWFQRKSTSHSNGAFLYHFGDSSTGVVSLFLTSLGALIFRTYGDGALKTWQTANGTIADDSWYNIVITHNGGGTILLYLNGVLTSWTSSSSFSAWGGIRPSGDCFLGNQSESSVQYLDGYIDSFFIMNAQAASNDILTLYRQEREYYNPVSIYAPTTKGFYKLDSRGLSWDPKFVDSSGQGNDSIASNNVAVIEEFDYADIFPINFPSASEIFGE